MNYTSPTLDGCAKPLSVNSDSKQLGSDFLDFTASAGHNSRQQ
ncbi:MAG: hypothetical protein AWU58_2109 [Methanohalophilus sp. T328-1]|nr:MAG: hypothetical protein AWU58_2109 [Methanohalophilus sp. T328-1]